MVNCPNCGNDVGESKFCPNCGSKIEEKKPELICPNCGADVGESNFCPKCGTKMIKEESNSICPNCGKDVGESSFCPDCGTKIENEPLKSFCPNCGEDVGNSSFCPSCGTKIGGEKPKRSCPSCGKSLNEGAKFCPYCGWSESQVESDNLDKLIDLDEKVSKKFSNVMGKSKLMGSFLDKTASWGYNNSPTLSSGDYKYYKKIEPVFIEALDGIEDDFVKRILINERSISSSSGGVAGIVASQIYTPTKDMSHDDAIKFYHDWANRIIEEINEEKRKGTFDEEEFYKKKVKFASIDNVSLFGISKSVKIWKNNQK